MGLIESFNYYYYDLADTRVKNWFLLKSIWTPITIILIYLVIVLKLAPAYMKNRTAYKLNTFIKCYNLFQIIVNAYLVKEFSSCYTFSSAFTCLPVIYLTNSCGMRTINAAYVAILVKIIDLIETVIFVLRKKNNQISSLHLYHHISTVLLAIIFARYLIVESAFLVPILNCSVHVIMYTYYFLSNFESSIKQMIMPYKRYLTIMQMGQFVILIMQMVSFLTADNCALPKVAIIVIILNITFNFGLFFNFYQKNYINQKRKNVTKKTT